MTNLAGMTETAAAETAAPASTAAPAQPAPADYVSAQADLGCSKFTVSVAGVAPHTVTTSRNPGPNPAAAHPWERAGLGVAPYKLIGAGTMTYQACPGAPVQCGGSCDYCGQAITQVFFVRAACGSAFHVGCDCARKACDKGEKVMRQIETERKKLEAAKRANLAARKLGELEALIEEHAEALRKIPHPREWAAAKGETMLDNAHWMLKNAGDAGRARLLAELRKVLGVKPAR